MYKYIINLIATFTICGATFCAEPPMITDPFLQLPTSSSVHVVWFTSFEGTSHWVQYGQDKKQVSADTRPLTRIRKEIPQPNGSVHTQKIPVWRHEAIVNLKDTQQQPYRVFSKAEDTTVFSSKEFTLSSAPSADKPLQILLTSDHQCKLMVAANVQKAAETIGHFDAVLAAGDLIELPDGYQEWFGDPRAFFPVLQGNANYEIEGNFYKGAPILQNTPVYSAIGNHEVMGRYSETTSIRAQYNDPYPREKALQNNPQAQGKELKDISFNTDTYEEVFTLPKNDKGNSTYYAVTIGDVRVIVLYATRIWRKGTDDLNIKSKYNEANSDLDNTSNWGYGDFIFESLNKGSEQYEWLVKELQSQEFQKANLRVVMLHNPMHTLGENATPPYVDPVQTITRDGNGKVTSVKYSYPKKEDILIKEIEPLLEQYGVDLVFCGHSHVWNRFQSPNGMHFLETSNVGNSYGVYTTENQIRRAIVPEHFPEDYAAMNDPNGLEPIVPNIAPLQNEKGETLPYVTSNTITVFSVLDTGRKVIDSYYFDCKHPELGVVKFDSFSPYRPR